ncbi:MAG TPA: glycosyltransferase [Ramlibacter sp.]|jgi:glycosyltransferase involved in cell wall biosynthesis|nr:glycosyltransferase [Ramlibacter sp.]
MGIHILHVVESFAAGTLRIVTQMTNRQALDGHRVSLAYSLREETPVDWRGQLDARVEPHHLAMKRELAPASDCRSLLGLVRLVGRLQPDIVHLHSSKAGALGRIASLARTRPRWYFSPHGLSFLQSSTPGRVHPVYLALERVLAHLPVSIIACSPSEAQLIAHHLHRRPLLVPNGIALDEVRTRGPRAADRSVVVGTAGRISQARHPELFARVARRVAGGRVRFVWLGGGEPQAEADLRRAGVEVSGWVPHAKLLELLAGLDIYMQPSRWEGLPVAVMEAMATGLPVVATDIVGNRDLVQHGRTGWLAASEDELVAGVMRLAGNAALRDSWGAAAREHVRSNHSTDNMMRHLYEAYGPGSTQDIPTMDVPRRAPYIEISRAMTSKAGTMRRSQPEQETS